MTETKTRGWGTPAFVTFVGVVVVLAVLWATLEILIRTIGPGAAAFVFILLLIFFFAGVGVGLASPAIAKDLHKDKPAPPQTSGASYQIVDASPGANATLPSITSSAWLAPRPADATFTLEFGNGRRATVAREAFYKVLSLDPVVRPKDWSWSNESYGDIKDYCAHRQWLYVPNPQRGGLWINRQAAIESVQSWVNRPVT